MPLVWGRYGRVFFTVVPVACTCPVPEPGAVAGAVVGDDPLQVDADASGTRLRLVRQNAGCGDGLLVVEDLGVDDAGAVIDRGVQVAVADPAVAALTRRCLGREYASRRRSGIPASFLMSTWINSPGVSR